MQSDKLEQTVESGGLVSPPSPRYAKLNKDGSRAGTCSEGSPRSMEMVFKGVEVLSWRKQVTIRAIIVSFAMGSLFSALLMKQTLTLGYLNPVNAYVGLVGYSSVNTWVIVVDKIGFLGQPFTRQETTIIQTCVLAMTSITVSGGFGSYIMAMSKVAADQTTLKIGENEDNIKDPHVGWIILFCLLTTFVALFFMVPLRKVMLKDFKLVFPSGTATAHLINCIHAPLASSFSRKQFLTLGKFFSLSFIWSLFQWLFSAGPFCGFQSFPILGFAAMKKGFRFDFLGTYVGVGMLCPFSTSISILLGSVLSWGFMWPAIMHRKGDWYSENLNRTNLHGLAGYKLFTAISMVLGDSLYVILRVSTLRLFGRLHKEVGSTLPVDDSLSSQPKLSSSSHDDQVRSQTFLNEKISAWMSWGCFLTLTAISVVIIPQIFRPVKWYHVAVMYMIAPVLAICAAHIHGVSDMPPAYNCGKLAMMILGGWVGTCHGDVLTSLVTCGVIVNFVSAGANLMVDFKTGYTTLTSSKSILASKTIGTFFGCVASPLIFSFFQKGCTDFGHKHTGFPAIFGPYYRDIAITSLGGLSGLPKHCLQLGFAFFAAAIITNIIKDMLPKKWSKFIPSPTAVAIPFTFGAYISIDMMIGCLIVFFWRLKNETEAEALAPLAASGLICGDGLWTLQSSVATMVGMSPPACAMFIPKSLARTLMGLPGPWLMM